MTMVNYCIAIGLHGAAMEPGQRKRKNSRLMWIELAGAPQRAARTAECRRPRQDEVHGAASATVSGHVRRYGATVVGKRRPRDKKNVAHTVPPRLRSNVTGAINAIERPRGLETGDER